MLRSEIEMNELITKTGKYEMKRFTRDSLSQMKGSIEQAEMIAFVGAEASRPSVIV